ncbi:hypothetical protein XAR_0279 [Xanthomonas citri pv. glycines str. 8ra]|nr:hypothetical protein XAR_0279 [Xanthomonas citri pv. glycines str. 8ra]
MASGTEVNRRGLAAAPSSPHAARLGRHLHRRQHLHQQLASLAVMRSLVPMANLRRYARRHGRDGLATVRLPWK